MGDAHDSITRPVRLWSPAEVTARPSPIPASPGVYGWYFRENPCGADMAQCVEFEGKRLLYVGIAPAAPPANGGPPSTGTLRQRIRAHVRGNASGSTLRLTLGIVLGLTLRATPSGRLTFGDQEQELNIWMENNAFVTWVETSEPWTAEATLIARLDLPLNLKGNRAHPYWAELTRFRRNARAAARALASEGR